jgi:hypothetical protein
MDKVIVIAPHSKCVNLSKRDCDTRAKEVAEKIHNLFGDAEIILSDEKREDFDLNRVQSRDRPWRRKLEDKVLEYYRDPNVNHIWVMEMHSFPRHSWEVLKDEKMVFVAIPEFAKIAYNIQNRLGPDVYLYQGSSKNDIQYAFAPLRNKVTVLLIESCEDKTRFTDSELDQNLEKIVNYIKGHKSSNSVVPKWILKKTEYEFKIRLLIALILILTITIIYMWGKISNERFNFPISDQSNIFRV